MGTSKGRRHRGRGTIEEQTSGSLRVSVYAGIDPLTGTRHYLRETVPAGPTAWSEAEKVRTRFLSQVDERRNPKSRVTVAQLLDRYVDVLDVDQSTRDTYLGYIERTIRPALAHLKLAQVDGEVLDRFYGQLRRCRQRCNGKARHIDHRTTREHECDKRCRRHVCSPMAASTVRQIHWILSGAFDRAVRWNYISVTPSGAAQPPPLPRPNPRPPTATEAALIVTEAWKEPEWGAFVWLAMTTGARRGEMCALRRSNWDQTANVLLIPRSVRGSRKTLQEKDTKTHQQRRVALDADTAEVLHVLLEKQDEDAKNVDLKIRRDAYLFSLEPDCSQPYVPDSVSQKYLRMTAQLGIETTLHKLRHYNATELLAAGVDLRTVAGRLGHGGGGATTLRVYAAWVDEAGVRAANAMAGRMPKRPSAAGG